ncbi:heme NO-binding domain-containing protein [Nitratidesulfovibrio sp. HK-II]|uniref:methyl-accepting chemotaxis protein n=1 Tax=Nitratidesulfovibrio sp. HK-II TaxID=2009266 RepID=UPI000E2FAF49|nr:methyl-accepting chemotaxis protein [Nitratidesulfovibrio sp. HK-II]GBO95826.1 methyl-accepting chemotaxis protein [Nitratidesulfovibrio sp. HK-II]
MKNPRASFPPVPAILGTVLSLLAAGLALPGGLLWSGLALCLGLAMTAGAFFYDMRIREARQDGLRAEFIARGPGRVLEDIRARGGSSYPALEEAARLEADTALLHAAFDVLAAPVLLLDASGRIARASKGASTLTGVPPDRMLGRTPADALAGGAGASGGLDFMPVVPATSLHRDVEFVTPGGARLSLQALSDSLADVHGAVSGAVVALIDHSDSRRECSALELRQQELLVTGADISSLAQRVASASEELSASSDEQARGAVRQKEQSASVATAMEQMRNTVLEVARNASATSDAARDARNDANEGAALVQRAVGGINAVAESADRLAAELKQLDGQAGEIGRIIGVINDIADQTNLLALNAAIEAARAGDAGRGFAVVADEVRKLAEKTMSATKEVEQAVRTIQQRSTDAMQSMQVTGAQVTESTQLSNEAGQAITRITVRIEDMVERVAQIATAAEQQSASAEEVTGAVEAIAAVAGESEAGATQASAATRDLAGLSQELLTLAVRFSEAKVDATKLWKSQGQMRGVLPKLMQEFAVGNYGRDVVAKVLEAMGNPVFLATGNYPDQVLKQMAHELSRITGDSTRDVFRKLGRYTMDGFYRMYRRYFKTNDLKEMYLGMDALHKQLTKDYPGINPPAFTYEDRGNTLIMTYRSSRALFEYFEGILIGAADFMRRKVDVKVTPQGEHTARAEIRFLD